MPRNKLLSFGYRKWYSQTFTDIDVKMFLIMNAILWPVLTIYLLIEGLTEGFENAWGYLFMLLLGIGIAFGIPLAMKVDEWYLERRRLFYNIPAPSYRVSKWALLAMLTTHLRNQGYEVDDNKFRETMIIQGNDKVRVDLEAEQSGSNKFFIITLCQRKSSDEFFNRVQKVLEQRIEIIYTESRLSESIIDARGDKDSEPSDEDCEGDLPMCDWMHGHWKITYLENIVDDEGKDESLISLSRSSDTPPKKIMIEARSSDLSKEIWHAPLAFTMENYSGGYFLLKDEKTGNFILPEGYKQTGIERIKVSAGEFDTVKISYKETFECKYCKRKKRIFECPVCEGKGAWNKDEDSWYESQTGILIKNVDKDDGEGVATLKELTSYEGVLGKGAS